MSHFMKTATRGAHEIGVLRAGVKVRYDTKKKALLIVEDEPPFVFKTDAKVIELPKGVPVIDSKGKAITASGQFFVTTETIDPFHGLVDMPAKGASGGS